MNSGDIFASPKGKYEIERRLGNGAFGIVYLSNYTPANSTTSMQVAVKEIARNYNNRETCKKEEELLKTISTSFTSEHVVKYIDSFADGDITVPSKIHSLSLFSLTTKYMLPNEDGKLFITMEFCSGGDLASKINEKIESGSEFDKETIFAYMSQIVDGIDELHIKHKIVHRDLKSANILIKEENGREVLKISDLGLAKLLNYDTVAANYPKWYGTPLYWAPEQEKGEKVQLSADIWAIGIIFYELCIAPRKLCDDHMHIRGKVERNEQISLPPRFHEHDTLLLNRMLVKDPSGRSTIRNICFPSRIDNLYYNLVRRMSDDEGAWKPIEPITKEEFIPEIPEVSADDLYQNFPNL